jgi:hypothetical protein
MSITIKKSFDVSRNEASGILKVSTRTLDRYISSKKLSTKNIAGRILLNRDEITTLAKQKRTHKSIRRKSSNSASRPNVQPENKDQGVYDIPVEHIVSEAAAEQTPPEELYDEMDIISSTEDRIYKKLYNELREDARVFQQRLEGANYRVGQLESQLKVSVPLLEHQKLLAGHKKERYNKRILYILLVVLLVLQPVWIILAFF